MDIVTLVAAGRVGLGLGTFLAPGRVLAPVGLDAGADDRLAYLSRIAGSRDVALGALTLVASGDARRALVLAGLAVDAADAVAGVVAGRRGGLDRRDAAVLTALPVASVATLARHLVRHRRTRSGDTAPAR